MTKLFTIILIIWLIYQIRQFIYKIQIKDNNKRTKVDQNDQMDIMDADFEDME